MKKLLCGEGNETFNKTKKQPTDWENLFASDIYMIRS